MTGKKKQGIKPCFFLKSSAAALSAKSVLFPPVSSVMTPRFIETKNKYAYCHVKNDIFLCLFW